MQEILSINIKYTLKDIRDFSFAKTRSGIFNKISFIMSVFLTIFFVLASSLIILTSIREEEMLVFASLMLLPILLIWGFTLLPAIILYLKQSSDFKKSKLLGLLQCFKLFEDRFEICSENGSFCLPWNDIYKVQELKPCILIQSSPGKIFIVSRRCFKSQEELDLFINILDSKVDKKKTRLKRFRIRQSMPDYGEIKAYESISETAELKNEQVKPIVEIHFSLTKNEYMDMNFRLYYTKPTGLIITAIGIILMLTSIRSIYLNDINSITPLLIGSVFTFVIPIMLYTNSIKRFERDVALQKPYVYKFYEDYYVVEHPSGTSRIKFCDLVKVVELKTAILLFITTQIAHIIPKRVFMGIEDDLITLVDLVKRKVPNKAAC